MSRKAYLGLTIWFVIVFVIVWVVSLPLQVWHQSLQSRLPRHVILTQLTGHWWSGTAELSVHNVSDTVHISWSKSSFFQPINWMIQHPHVIGHGQLSMGFMSVSTWIDDLIIEPIMFNDVLSSNGISLQGQAIEITRWYSRFDLHDQRFEAFQVNADWLNGRVRYQQNGQSHIANIDNWQFSGSLQESFPVIELRSNQQNSLLDVKLLADQKLEITVMPKLIELFGHYWPGEDAYPAFVMVQPFTTHWLK